VTDELALFIDFENIRYSLINVQHREPDPQELIALARRFGTVMVARAYADWTRQPEFFKGSLTAAMIDRVDCPAKVRERFRQAPQFQHQGPYVPGAPPSNDDLRDEDEGFGDGGESEAASVDDAGEAERDDAHIEAEADEAANHPDDSGSYADRRPRGEPSGNGYGGYGNGNGGYIGYNNGHGGYNNGYNNGAYPAPSPVITQSTVDLNMLMDIIETVFDRPNISTFILMTGDRDFTRISARLKLRLNKRVVVVGIPGTVSRDLISSAETFIPLGAPMPPMMQGGYHPGQQQPYAPLQQPYAPQQQGPVEPEEPGFIQFLDYIDRHWSWRTVGGVANFIGDPYNPKNRFRGRLTRDSARDLLRICIDEGILSIGTDAAGSENLRLNRTHPAVDAVLNESAMN
jgi:uncharacterized LabA/DUF88 family protein